ncbi:MAG TPA: inositol monophosphatase family protein, partial [Actinomycetota bacterium]|nr:inositol monophosphatase family protein [Actinomycetota bacterium]
MHGAPQGRHARPRAGARCALRQGRRVLRPPGLLAELAALATDLAHRAAEIQRDGRRRGFEIREKSAAGDLVTEIDKAGERAIVEGILAARADDAILGEEGTDRAGTSGVRWVIDPLDGTASYVRGYPGYAVSIGIEVDGRPAVGVVEDALGRVTVGVAGGGAERDGRPVRPSERSTLAD